MNFKRDAFNIVSIAIQNTILPEIVSVQPMATAAQLLPLLEIRYGKTKGEVTEGDLVLDSTGAGKTNKFYDSEVVENQVVANGTQNIVIPFVPVVPGTLKIVKGATVITDNGDGTLSDNGTINYAEGIVKLNVALDADATMSYTYNNANVPTEVGDLTMGINPVLIEAKEHKLKAVYALTAAYRINKEYGVNMPLTKLAA